MKRKSISARTRFEIFKRDNFICQYCGSHPPSAILHIDHIIPVAKGGDNADTNLVTACSVCNGGKAAVSLKTIPMTLKEKAAQIVECEAQVKGYAEIALAKRERLDEETWQVAEIYMRRFGRENIRRDNFQSIRNFVDKLGIAAVLEAMEYAVNSRVNSEYGLFKYFCSICWKKIKAPTP